jgi:tetratricopeptide (TPR) repeat protein
VRGLAFAAIVLAVLASACRAQNKTNSAPRELKAVDRSALQPVSLPDLSPMAPAVQTQLRDGYVALTRVRENASATPHELGEAFGQLGKLLLAAESHDVAEACFQNAHALVPDEARWPYYLGRLYSMKGNPTGAARWYTTALELNPGDAVPLLRLGDAYLELGRPEAAEPPLTKALSLQPGSAAALLGLGRVALAQSEYSRAVMYLEDALAREPMALTIHYPLAMAYRGLGDVTNAEAHLRLRGDVNVPLDDPLMQEVDGLLETAEAYEFRGNQALSRGNWTEAAARFRRGLELAPESATMRHQLGTALALGGDSRGAMEQFREAIRHAPTFAKARLSLGVLLEVNGHRQEAIEQLSAAARSDPQFVEAHFRLAQVLRQDGRADESLSHYARALRIDPGASDVRLEYAAALVSQRRYREAREQLTEGVRLHPEQPDFAQALAGLQNATP